jgi:hypothetical protein
MGAAGLLLALKGQDKRTISRKDLGLVVRITVSKAMVSRISAGNYQLEALDLEIEADNLNP